MPVNEPEPRRDPYTEASSPVQSFVVQAILPADAPARERRGRPLRGQRAVGDYRAAREKFQRALAIVQEIGDRSSEAATWRQLATLDMDEGDYLAAREKFERALAIFQQIGDRASEAATWRELGTIDLGPYTKATSDTDAVAATNAGGMSHLVLLLRGVAGHARSIRSELPGWYPHYLLPVLRNVLVAVRAPACRMDELDAHAARMAAVLRQRPETEHIPRVLELAACDAGRAMRPMSELPETIALADRLRNECEVLTEKIIQALEEPNRIEQSDRPADATDRADTADRDRIP
jgi:tetratricopeptide (TPR) repeat protein